MRRKTYFVFIIVAAACGDSTSNDTNGGPSDGGAGEEARGAVDGASDVGSSDVTTAGDGTIADGASSDGATDGGTLAEGGVVYNDLNDPTKWEAVRPGSAGVMGAAFDGRYVYFGPHNNTAAWRYDTQGPWDGGTYGDGGTAFDVHIAGQAAGVVAGQSDGGSFVYLVPSGGVPPQRYDTAGGAFEDAGAWSSYDLATAIPGAVNWGFGGTFDGRWFYTSTGAGPGLTGSKTWLVRNDSNAAGFTTWETFDPTILRDKSDAGFTGGVTPGTDGTYVYYCGGTVGGGGTGMVARYDARGDFSDAGSWQVFNVGSLKNTALQCGGAVFDGRYMYFVPDNYSFAADTVARFDTTMPLDAAGAWSFFDMYDANKNVFRYTGGTFDGRYVYFVPFDTGIIARVDTTAPFTAASSWQFLTIDVGSGTSYAGATFDGRYVYFAPYGTGPTPKFVRFDARSPPALPPKPQGGTL